MRAAPRLRALSSARNRWAAIAEQEAQQQLGSPDYSINPSAAARGGRPGDRSSTGSANSGLGSSGRGGGGGGADGDGYHQAPGLTTSTSSSITFGGERRYSGGTIGIASMLGSLCTVPTGRSISDGGMDRRVSSVVGPREVPMEFAGLGASGGAWRRQSTMGPGIGGGRTGGVYPRWGAPVGGAAGSQRDVGGGGAGGGGGRGGEGVVDGAAAAAAGTSWSIDVGVDGSGGSKGEEREEHKSQIARASSPDGAPPGGDLTSSLPNQASPATAVQAPLAEAPRMDFPEVLPE